MAYVYANTTKTLNSNFSLSVPTTAVIYQVVFNFSGATPNGTVDCALVGTSLGINTTANKNGEGEATASGSAIVNSSTTLRGSCIDDTSSMPLTSGSVKVYYYYDDGVIPVNVEVHATYPAMTNIPKNNGTVSPQWIWEHCELDTTTYPNNYYNTTFKINDVIVNGTTLMSSYAQGTYVLKIDYNYSPSGYYYYGSITITLKIYGAPTINGDSTQTFYTASQITGGYLKSLYSATNYVNETLSIVWGTEPPSVFDTPGNYSYLLTSTDSAGQHTTKAITVIVISGGSYGWEFPKLTTFLRTLDSDNYIRTVMLGLDISAVNNSIKCDFKCENAIMAGYKINPNFNSVLLYFNVPAGTSHTETTTIATGLNTSDINIIWNPTLQTDNTGSQIGSFSYNSTTGEISVTLTNSSGLDYNNFGSDGTATIYLANLGSYRYAYLEGVPYTSKYGTITDFEFRFGVYSEKIAFGDALDLALKQPATTENEWDNYYFRSPLLQYNKTPSNILNMTYHLHHVPSNDLTNRIVLGAKLMTKMFDIRSSYDLQRDIYVSSEDTYTKFDNKKVYGTKITGSISVVRGTNYVSITFPEDVIASGVKSWALATGTGDLLIAFNRYDPYTQVVDNTRTLYFNYYHERS